MGFHVNELGFLVFQTRFLVRFLSSYYNRNAFANVGTFDITRTIE